ncbi:chromosome segregation protein SMC [Bacillus toyonensis]
MDSLEGSFKGLQATFEQGFADVHKGLNEIIEINKHRKTAREIVEGIAGNGK